jgi:hypothetical protein
MASGIGIEGSCRGAKEVVVRVICVTLFVSSSFDPGGMAHTVSTTASSKRRVEGILFQLAPVNLAEEGPGVAYRSTLIGRGESAGDRAGISTCLLRSDLVGGVRVINDERVIAERLV